MRPSSCATTSIRSRTRRDIGDRQVAQCRPGLRLADALLRRRMRSTTDSPMPSPRRPRPSRSATASIRRTRWGRSPTIAASTRWRCWSPTPRPRARASSREAPRIGNRGYYFPLTVLADVPDDARAMREEPFGPLALISRVRIARRGDREGELRALRPRGLRLHQFGAQRRSAGGGRRGRQPLHQPLRRLEPPRRRSAASRTAASGAKAAPRGCSVTRSRKTFAPDRVNHEILPWPRAGRR